MRIDRPKDLAKTRKKTSTGKAKGTGQTFTLANSMPAASLTGAQATSNISNIGALLSAQEVDGPTAQAEYAVKRGSEMLDMLDLLKIGLLSGQVAPHTLNRLKSLATKTQHLDGNEGLKKILTSIELRAEVELAKLVQQNSR